MDGLDVHIFLHLTAASPQAGDISGGHFLDSAVNLQAANREQGPARKMHRDFGGNVLARLIRGQ